MLPSGNITMVTFLVFETVFGMIVDEFLFYWFSNNSDDDCEDGKLQKKLVLEITPLSFYILMYFSFCNNYNASKEIFSVKSLSVPKSRSPKKVTKTKIGNAQSKKAQ